MCASAAPSTGQGVLEGVLDGGLGVLQGYSKGGTRGYSLCGDVDERREVRVALHELVEEVRERRAVVVHLRTPTGCPRGVLEGYSAGCSGVLESTHGGSGVVEGTLQGALGYSRVPTGAVGYSRVL
jgi:hypothetical protein